MAVPLSRPLWTPFAVLILALAISAMGIGASLVKTFSNHFTSSSLGGGVRQLLFAAVWDTLFGIIYLVGNFVAPTSVFFGLTPNFAISFVGFLQFLVGSAGLTFDLQKWGCLEKCSMFRALEGLSWAITWLTFFQLIVIAKAALTRSPEPKGKEVQATGV